MHNKRVIFLLILCLATLFFAIREIRDISRQNSEIERHNSLVTEASDCLASGDWICAEKGIRALLAETPDDTNLQLHLAGILFEQERYEDCIRYVDSVQRDGADFKTLKEKSQTIMREMRELKLESSDHFRLEFEGSPALNDILEALSVLEVAYDSLCRLFDFRPANKMALVLYQSSEYQGTGPRPDWVGAVFDGKLRVPVNVMQYREVYRPMLFHELTHAFVRAMTRAKVPLWLNEGIAQVIDASRNGRPRPEGPVPDLNMLTQPFVNQENTDVAVRLYWYSQRMVEALLYRDGVTRGDDRVVESVRKLRACIQDLYTLGTDGALKKHYGLTAAQLLEQVR